MTGATLACAPAWFQGKSQQTLWAKRSCCVRAPLERNLEAAEGDRTEAAVRLVNARCMLENWIAVLD